MELPYVEIRVSPYKPNPFREIPTDLVRVEAVVFNLPPFGQEIKATIPADSLLKLADAIDDMAHQLNISEALIYGLGLEEGLEPAIIRSPVGHPFSFAILGGKFYRYAQRLKDAVKKEAV